MRTAERSSRARESASTPCSAAPRSSAARIESCQFHHEPEDGDAAYPYFVQASSADPASSLDIKVSVLDGEAVFEAQP